MLKKNGEDTSGNPIDIRNKIIGSGSNIELLGITIESFKELPKIKIKFDRRVLKTPNLAKRCEEDRN